MTELPQKTFKRIISQEGARRVSYDSSKALAVFIEEITRYISSIAISLADHAGRKTVKDRDIQKAIEIMTEERILDSLEGFSESA